MLWTLDERRTDGLLAVEYPYFEAGGALSDEELRFLEGAR